jgi:hypothetical protein
MLKYRLLVHLVILLTFTSCSIPASSDTTVQQNAALSTATSGPSGSSNTLVEVALEATPLTAATSTPQPELAQPAAPTARFTATAEAEGNSNASAASQSELNPLTGLPCADPALLELPPALVSVSNFPVTARPQAGLSFSPYVFEMYIGEGMTRFLALFYCNFPAENVSGDNTIGPIRSGRLPYESLRKLYNGFLIMASASGEVSTQLSGSTNIFGSDNDDINSALIDVGKLKGIALKQAGNQPPNLTGNLFDQAVPEGGLAAERLWMFYNFYNQAMWTFDESSGLYLRAQDNADGSGKFTPSTDRLTGEPLGFENVIVLYTEHEVLNSEGTLIDVNLLYSANKAYLFRDGQMIPIRWTTVGGDYEKTSGKLRPIRFVDAAGNPVALKPGRVWVQFVHFSTTLGEVEPGMWKARFYAP